jgi:hypothetical protein
MKTFLTTFLILGGIFMIFNLSHAQAAPQFMITWKTDSFVPANYQGKIFPTQGSTIEMGLDLVVNNKIVDLSKKNIKWSIGGQPSQTKIGLTKIKFKTNKSSEDQTVEVSILKYNTSGNLNAMVVIPIHSPEIVIDSASYNNEVKISEKNIFKALPFFFDVPSLANLSFSWFINGSRINQESANRPDLLSLNLVSQGEIYQDTLNLSVTIQNIVDKLQSASKSLDLNIIQ